MTDYKTKFNEDTAALIATNIADRTERMAAVQALIDRYIEENGEVPDRAQLERLTDYVLREELTDPNLHKVLHNEYPFLSETQLERRRFGARGSEDSNMRGEVSLNIGDDIDDSESRQHSGVGSQLATDGKTYRYPIRRTRSKQEQIFLDENTKIRNKRRAKQYKKDTAPGEVMRYNLFENGGEVLPSFVSCVGIAERVKQEASVVDGD